MNILIAGAGLGGLAAALKLHRLGLRVTVIDTGKELRPLEGQSSSWRAAPRFSADGKSLFVEGDSKDTGDLLWELTTGKVRRPMICRGAKRAKRRRGGTAPREDHARAKSYVSARGIDSSRGGCASCGFI